MLFFSIFTQTYVAYRDDTTALPPFDQDTVRGLYVIAPPQASPSQPTSDGETIWMTESYLLFCDASEGTAMRKVMYLPLSEYVAWYWEKVKPVSGSL
jgi:hypothetical protein